MKINKRGIAWLLAASVLVSTPGFQTQTFGAYTAADPIQEKEIKATGSNAEGPDEDFSDADPIIYWNPGKRIQVESAEDERMATDSDANGTTAGSSLTAGLHPSHPVKSLSAAVGQAKRLAERLDVPEEDMVIYAMNPMEIQEGEAYFLDGKGMTVKPWDGREAGDDLVFQVKGGQLSLKNVNLQIAGETDGPEDISLVQVDAGKVQLGEGAVLSGAITLNYENEDAEETATASNAGQKQADQLPVVELLSDFDSTGLCYLDVRAGEDMEQIELVRTMYADEMSPEEFLEQFRFSGGTDLRWEMKVVQKEGGTLRKAGRSLGKETAALEDAEGKDGVHVQSRLTRKTLVARAGEGNIVYWNPGGSIEVNGSTYPEGNDRINDGSTPEAPVKTWEYAVENKNAATVICMQPLKLEDTEVFRNNHYLPYEDGQFVLDGNRTDKVRLSAWTEYPRSALIVPQGTELVMRNIELKGISVAGSGTETNIVLCDGGQLILDDNISTEDAYIQVDLNGTNGAEDHPIQVNNNTVSFHIFFGGINENLSWRFLDVIVPGEGLAPAENASLDEKRAIGELLKTNITLEDANAKLTGQGGTSLYEWRLEPDGLLDGKPEDAQNLELYAEYYYDAVYLNGKTGNDASLGASCQNPVKTFERAKEILTQEIERSVEARKQAKTPEEREKIVVPDTIYICDTVTVDQTAEWEMGTFTDWDGTPISVSLKTHKQTGTVNHATPDCLVHVKGEDTTLTLGQNLVIENIADKMAARGIAVTHGATLVMDKNAVLTGKVNGKPTKGRHIEVGIDPEGPAWQKYSGHVWLKSTWTGKIEYGGVGIEASGTDGSTILMEGGSICENNSYGGDSSYTYGGGVYCGTNVTFTMTGGEIRGNKSDKGGAGVYVTGGSRFLMEKGVIKGNSCGGNLGEQYGAGVFLNNGAEFQMGKEGSQAEDCVISGNSASRPSQMYGAGLCAYSNTKVTIWNGTIKDNRAYQGDHYGIGIYTKGQKFLMYNGNIINNDAVSYGDVRSVNGGGIYAWAEDTQILGGTIQGHSTKSARAGSDGGGLYLRKADSAGAICKVENVIIKGNEAEDGGGAYISDAVLKNCVIENNTATRSGGGVYGYGSIADSQITGNEAQDGGGIYRSIKGRNLDISGNTASNYGGGVFTNTRIQNNSASIGGGIFANDNYLTLTDDPAAETGMKKSCVTGNTAVQKGGGIYCDVERYNIKIQLETEMKNEAQEQGNNLYWESGTIYLYSGNLSQPSENTEHYNLYLDNQNNSGYCYIDPKKVTINGDQHHLYMNTATSYLNYLCGPEKGNLPIDLNEEEFKVGSVVIKPVTSHKGTVSYVDADLKEQNKELSYEEYLDASQAPDGYYAGSVLPPRTQFGGFQDPVNPKYTNMILVGEGVYLSGSGDDKNKGTSPHDAVKTFSRAKGLLEEYTDEANRAEEDADGFSHFIYICGNVPVTEREQWELNGEEARYTTASKYVEYETKQGRIPEPAQVKRFTSFITKPMISVENNGSLTLGTVEINGQMDGVDRTTQGSKSPILFVEAGGTAVLEGNANLRNNYQRVSEVSGILTLTGTETDRNQQIQVSSGTGVRVNDGGTLNLEGFSRILGEMSDIGRTTDSLNGASGSSTAVITMSENSSIQKGEGETGQSFENGIVLYGQDNVIPELSMTDQAFITDSTYGVLLNRNGNIEMKGYSSIWGNTDGIGVESFKSQISLWDNASIHENTTDGIIMKWGQEKGSLENKVSLHDSSRIWGNQYGIYLDNDAAASVIMNGSSQIDRNKRDGIGCSWHYIDRFSLEMKEESSIRSNGRRQISLEAGSTKGKAEDKVQIRLSENASVIGGLNEDETYSEIGIAVQSACIVRMEGNSRIEQKKGKAMSLSCLGGKGITQEIDVTMSDQAKIQVSDDAVGVLFYNNGYPNSNYRMTMKDSAKIITGDGAAIDFQEEEGNCYLEGQASIQSTKPYTDQDTVLMTGTLNLEGTASVKGQIYLRNGEKPIILESAVAQEVSPYKLHLASGFVGQTVVKPDGRDFTDAAAEIEHFQKVLGDGLAEEKNLLPNQTEKTIILAGENNVYLSGKGDDANSGLTPDVPVRTFKRAKELLEGAGYFGKGANIYICDTVYVEKGDENWGFSAGGQVTNTQSGQTWTPVVKPYDTLRYTMISVGPENSWGNPPVVTLTLSHITIDVDKKDITIVKCGEGNNANKTLILEDGAVITGANSDGSSLFAGTGTMIMEGGEIRDNTVSDLYNAGMINVATFQMKGGKICNNQISGSRGVALIMGEDEASVQIMGGTIEENQIKSVDGIGSAIYITVDEYEDMTCEISGGIIRKNGGTRASAIYYAAEYKANSPRLIISGGIISENYNLDGSDPIQINSPIRIDAKNFELKGGTAAIEDGIYLSYKDYMITLSGAIYQDTRKYTVYLGSSFGKGDTVVKPDGNWLMDAKPYLTNFNVISHPYILDRGQSVKKDIQGATGIKEVQCLILMQAVFLDAEHGDDSYDGTTPAKAVKTFKKAQEVGGRFSSDYYVIYVSGPVRPEDGEVLTLPEPAYMCRYTGFPVYEKDGTPAEKRSLYYGYMIEPQGSLNLSDIRIYGRRYIDDNSRNGESILHVTEGTEVTVGEGTALARNQNLGTFIGPDGLAGSLSAKGGAAAVEAGGLLKVNGGSITEMGAANGAAIYLAVGTEGKPYGKLELDQKPRIDGDVFLAGKLEDKVHSPVIQVSEQYQPGETEDGLDSRLYVNVEADWDGKQVVQYPEDFVPTAQHIDHYRLEDHILAVYDFLNAQNKPNILELYMRKCLYLDGENGSDQNTGESPAQALKTLKAVYEKLQRDRTAVGTLVFVVDEVTIGPAMSISLSNEIKQDNDGRKRYSGIYSEEEDGKETERIETGAQVFFKRYSQPEDLEGLTGYDKETYKGTLFTVNGTLTLSGVYLDGHNAESVGSQQALRAAAVEAEGPLVTVSERGYLYCKISQPEESGNQGITTETLFQNNTNILAKNKVIGTDRDGKDVYEGSGAGIELLGGRCELEGTRFQNLLLGDKVASGGTDVYDCGHLTVSNATHFTGSVFLEGFGSPEDKQGSRIISIKQQGTPILEKFQLNIRDPYHGRPVVQYPDHASESDIGYYLLEDRINRSYSLVVSDSNKRLLELRIPQAVYIDGQDGIDTSADPDGLGWTPDRPVKTLEKAYRLLKERSGKIIYVVNTVDINEDISLTGRSYEGGKNRITLSSSTDRVEIRRYVKPIAAKEDSSYRVEDFNGVMFRILSNGGLNMTGNQPDTPGVESQMILDGHREIKADPDEAKTMHTDHGADAEAPMIAVEEGGSLFIGKDVILRDNDNQSGAEEGGSRLNGGALYNAGVAELSGAVIRNNDASKGAGIYQAGTLTLGGDVAGLKGQEIYLASENQPGSGSWEDHVITSQVWLEDPTLLNLNMDHAVKGRDVVVYNGYADVDEQHSRYELGETVPEHLFLAQALDYNNILELQDWQVLDVEVPEEIFLAIRKDGNGTSILNGASASAELTSPEYEIVNRGRYKVRVSLGGVTDKSESVGIDPDVHRPMKLVENSHQALGADQLYLALEGVKAMGDAEGENGFASLECVPLATLMKPDAAARIMGILDPGKAGRFQFKAQASDAFLNAYMDPEFPLEGTGSMEGTRKDHYRTIDPVTGDVKAEKARAMFQMTYRLELEPSDQNLPDGGQQGSH